MAGDQSRVDERMWQIEVLFTEEDRATRADAILDVRDHHYHGWGRARRNPEDTDAPLIGEEIAACRALSDLAHELLDAAATEISTAEGRPVTLHG